MSLKAAIERRYPQSAPRIVELRSAVQAACAQFLESGMGDRNAERRLCSVDDADYWQQLSEVLLAHQLQAAGRVLAHQATGPDFLIEIGGRRHWIEVITPTPAGVPDSWLAPPGNGPRDFPHEEILLRWTAAIKQKMEVLMGKPDGFPGYLKNGVVGHDDVYVIAVNGRLLRGFGGTFGELNGISQFPFAVEATFAIGPLHIRIDRNTLVSGQPKHQERYLMEKPIGQPVPADTFLTAEYSNISAIWATDICELSLRGSAPASAVVHNPRARNPLPLGFLPAQNEYVARQIDDNSYQLDRTDGTLADKGS